MARIVRNNYSIRRRTDTHASSHNKAGVRSLIWYFIATHNGKRYQRSLKTTDFSEAEARAKDLYAAIVAGVDEDNIHVSGPPPRVDQVIQLTWDDIFTQMEKKRRRPWSAKTRWQILSSAKKFAAHLGKEYYDLTSRDFTQENIDSWVEAMTKEGLRASTRNAYLFKIRQAVTAINGEVVVPLPEPTIKAYEAPDPGVIKRIIEDMDELPVDQRRLLMLCLGAGLRRGEAANARWSWINARQSRVHVTPNDSWKPKNGKGRSVPMFEDLMTKLIKTRKNHELHNDLIVGHAAVNTDRYIAPELIKWLKSKGWGKRRDEEFSYNPLHELRKYYGSVIVSRSGSIYKAQKALGHSSFAITEQIYTDLIEDEAERFSLT